jgi:gamma-glutamyltranspeptidase/glutathione hydrolase
MRTLGAVTAFSVGLLGVLLWHVPTAQGQGPSVGPARAPSLVATGSAAVASENALATRAALAQLQAGGNAIDAAITAALVGGVASPASSGIGGGGFALVWIAAERKLHVLDFRETAPRAIDAASFEQRPFPVERRGQLVGVPGEVQGLWELHRRFGRSPWSELFTPAVRAARQGFLVGQHLGSTLQSYESKLTFESRLQQLYYPRGRALPLGARVRVPELARTLERIAEGGPDAFYAGATAADIRDTVRAAGGGLELQDLREYRVRERAALCAGWAKYDVCTLPPPSAGGLMLLQSLAVFTPEMLARLDPKSPVYAHLVAEAMRGSLADRLRFVGDPEHVRVDVASLLGSERMTRRRATIRADRTRRIPEFALEGGGTHHLVVADKGGNVVSLTTTVNTVFGAKLVTAGGIVLNDELDDFTAQRDVTPLGLERSPNRPRPGARPVSSMTPAIVFQGGQWVLALGGSGGPAIATNVTQTVLARLAFDRAPRELARSPRFLVPTRGDTLWVEPGTPDAWVRELTRHGEQVGVTPFTKSAVQAVTFDGSHVTAVADPRKHGAAGAL